MSKKRKINEEDSSYMNFWHNFNGSNADDDENDESYCFLEDKLQNFNKYKNDNMPYEFSIPKKEVFDVLNDPDNLLYLYNEELNYDTLSVKSRRKKSQNNLNIENMFENLTPLAPKIESLPTKTIKKRKRISKNNSMAKLILNHSSENEMNLNKTSSNIFQMNMSNNVNSFTSSINNSYYKNRKDLQLPQYPTDGNNNNNNLLTNNRCNMNGVASKYTPLQMDSVDMIKLLIKQYDFFLQILIQNILLTTDQGLKHRCYTMLFSFYVTRQRIITTAKLVENSIRFSFSKIFDENRSLKLRPQISFFQAPLLEILPILVKFMKKSFNKDEVIIILKEFFPFINPQFLPIKWQSSNCNFTNNSFIISRGTTPEKNQAQGEGHAQDENQAEVNEQAQAQVHTLAPGSIITLPHLDNNFLNKKRKKFDTVHDNLLIIGLMHHGKKNLELVQQLWLNSRSIQEIRHRIKNLTCKRAPENIIKEWKLLNSSPPAKNEFAAFLKGLQWFGFKRRWSAISNYFLPHRSPDYLENLFENLINHGIIKLTDTGIYDETTIKKKKQTKMLIYSNYKLEYLKEFEKEINNLNEDIKNYDSKNNFYSPEQHFEKFEIDEIININTHGNINHMSTRNKSYTNHLAYYNSLQNFKYGSRNRNPIFDFHIKKSDDSAYEKMEII